MKVRHVIISTATAPSKEQEQQLKKIACDWLAAYAPDSDWLAVVKRNGAGRFQLHLSFKEKP